VRFGFSGGDHLVPNVLRKRNIDQAVAVDMPEFPLSQAELYPPKR
jgi:hypothetical protein